MKKSMIVVLLSFLSSVSMAYADANLNCVSLDEVHGWVGTSTDASIYLTAQVVSSAQLKKAEVRGAYESDQRDLNADRNYKPRNPKYQGMNRFSVLEDAWCWFAPLLPKGFAELPPKKKFLGYLQVICEGGRASGYGLSCSIE